MGGLTAREEESKCVPINTTEAGGVVFARRCIAPTLIVILGIA